VAHGRRGDVRLESNVWGLKILRRSITTFGRDEMERHFPW